MALLVRPLSLHDKVPLEQLVDIIEEFTAEEKIVAREVLADAYTRPDDYRFLVACINDQVAGYLAYGPTPMTAFGFDLYWLATGPSFRRLGVGRALVKALDDVLAKLPRATIRVETSSQPHYKGSVDFYLAEGYVESGRIKDFYKLGDDLILLSRSLGNTTAPELSPA